MNQNHTITMNAQQMQRRPYINSRGAISRNMNHRMQRMSFGQSQQSHHNHRNNNNNNNNNNSNGGNNNQNKDLDCFNGNNSHSG
jgi:hypothetical protein